MRTYSHLPAAIRATIEAETHFSSEGTSCIRCPQNGYPLQLRHSTEISKFASWAMMASSTRSYRPVTKMEPNGSMLQARSTQTCSRRIGANGLNAIRSNAKAFGGPHRLIGFAKMMGFAKAQPILQTDEPSGVKASLICPTGSRREFLSTPSPKNKSLRDLLKSALRIPSSRLVAEGRIAIVTDVERGMRWTRQRRARDRVSQGAGANL